MKERLLIISDLWGIEKSKWLTNYTRILEARFNVEFYDSCEIGQIDTTNYTQENLHNQFINGGIEIAVDRLVASEKQKVNILAFSIGGTIAWNFGLKSGCVQSLVCVSSTRLRKETKRPEGFVRLYFGEKDDNKPNKAWLESMNVEHFTLTEKGHQVYFESQFAEELSNEILKTIPQQHLQK